MTTLELLVPAVPAPRTARDRPGAGAAAPIRLAVPGRALVLVAGMPGAGKSTLLAGLPRRPGLVVLDSDEHRAALARRFPRLPYRRYRWLVHLRHRLAAVRAAWSGAPTVVVHLPATSTALRTAVALLAAQRLVRVDVQPQQVRGAPGQRGQRERGRLVPSGSFAGHARRAAAAAAALRAGRAVGWRTVLVAGRPAARAGLVLDTRVP